MLQMDFSAFIKDNTLTVVDFNGYVLGSEKINSISALLNICNSLEIYEYYDGIHVELTTNDLIEKKFIISCNNQHDVYTLFTTYISQKIVVLSNLHRFKYTSRFSSELSYAEFTDAPLSLTHFEFATNTDINPKFMINAKHVTIGWLNTREWRMTSPNLETLVIHELHVDEFNDISSLLQYLKSLSNFKKLVVNHAIEYDGGADVDMIYDTLMKELGNKFSRCEQEL